jgi:hypothetical protein
MAVKKDSKGAQRLKQSEILNQLDPIEIQKEKLPAKLEDIPLEAQMLPLAEISLERETEALRELLRSMGKL